jgi:hypothetical protein
MFVMSCDVVLNYVFLNVHSSYIHVLVGIILTRSILLCVITISTKEYSLAQQYVFKLINQVICFSCTATIRPIYNHLLSYIC